MSRVRITIEVDLDDASLAQHSGENAPPPNDLADWDASDLLAAQELEILDLREADLTDIERQDKAGKWEIVK